MMRAAIVQFDSRDDHALSLFAPLIARNRQYAKNQGYDYFFIRKCNLDLPAYWLKPHLVGEFLGRGYESVLWLDTDAVIHDLTFRIENLFVADEVFVYAPDLPQWSSDFNAGVFACKGALGAELMRKWAASFPADQWEKNSDAWICKTSHEDDWAGLAYEQGCFSRYIIPDCRQHLRVVPWQLFQSPFPLPESFTLHFPQLYKINMPVYMATVG